jgi:hypothetical protein
MSTDKRSEAEDRVMRFLARVNGVAMPQKNRRDLRRPVIVASFLSRTSAVRHYNEPGNRANRVSTNCQHPHPAQ